MLKIVPNLIQHNAITFFANYFKRVVGSQVSILIKTTIPNNIASLDPCIINAFKFLDKARTSGDNILSRLAYIRLVYVFESLNKIVASDWRKGQLSARISSYCNASIAIDIYIEAQEQVGISRDKVNL